MVTDSPPEPPARLNADNARPRDGGGHFVRNIDTARRDAAIAEQRSRSWSWRAIAEHHGMAIPSCHEAYHRALAEVITPAGETARATELEKLDRLERSVLAVLERDHIVVQHGKVITDPVTGGPMSDDGPVVSAAATLMRIGESRRKLLGLDAPATAVVDSTVRYEVVGLDATPAVESAVTVDG